MIFCFATAVVVQRRWRKRERELFGELAEVSPGEALEGPQRGFAYPCYTILDISNTFGQKGLV